MKQFISTAILFFALIFSNALQARVYYVNAGYTGSTENGNTWATPFKKLDGAVAAAVDGDEIWLAKGTYVAPEFNAGLNGYIINNSISIYGGFTGTETSIYARNIELNKTILKGFGNNNNYNMFNLKPNKLLLLDGLDLTAFGVCILRFYDSNTNSFNLQAGDRYKLTINNCNFYDGSSPFVLEHSTDLTVSNSSFKNVGTSPINSSTSALGTDPLIDYSIVKFTSSVFEYTSSNSTILYCSNAQFDIVNCNFNIQNSSTMFSYNECRGWRFKGCTFNGTRNNIVSGSTMTAARVIEDCIFENFSGSTLFYGNGGFSTTEIPVKISNTIFRNSTNAYEIIVGNSSLELDHVTFSNISFGNSNVFGTNQGNIKITNSTFENLSSSNNDCTLMNYNMGNIEIDNVTYKNNSIPFINRSQYTPDTAKTTILNSSLQNNTIRPGATNPSLITVRGQILISNSTISDNTYLWSSSRPNLGIITINSASVFTAVNSIFENNVTNYQAGVIYQSQANMSLNKCDFSNNDNTAFDINSYFSNAGAIVSVAFGSETQKIENCTFTNNKSNSTGAVLVQSPKIEINKCVFKKNQSLSTVNTENSNQAAALTVQIYSATYHDAVVSNCLFSENISGGPSTVYISSGSEATTNILQSIFEKNVSNNGTASLGIDGGTLNVYNTLFDNNISPAANKGIIKRGPNTKAVNFYNCTFVKNQAPGSGLFTGLVPNVIANSILWANGTESPINLKDYPTIAIPSLISVTNSVVEGGFATGTKIYDTNPKFVDFAAGNYRLSCQSPLINKGNNALGISLSDLDNTPRIFADTIDIGAYETHVDPALANVIPAPSFTIPASVCKDELIQTENTTANIGNYNYQWVFGNGQKSTQVAPNYLYTQAGTYTVQLTASNFCGQTNTTSKQITVKNNNAPVINTVSVICPGAEETYTTNAVCQTIEWTVTGGTIQSGQGTKTIKVLWGNGAAGNGKITLRATGCGTDACEIPVSVEVPIVPVSFTLAGLNKTCQGSLVNYGTANKDKSPATLYTWSVKGGTINSNTSRGYNLTDIDVSWNATSTEGVVYLTTYNELLKCGKTDSFKVNVRPNFKLSGNTDVCTGNSINYQITPSVGAMNWQVTGADNAVAGGYVTWGSSAGTYKITAVPQDLSLACNAQDTFLVQVHAKPVITGISGETELAANATNTYTGLTDTNINDINFQWSSPGATILSTYSNNATLLRNSFSPDNISLSVSTKKGSCSSDPFTINVKKLFDYIVTGADSVCFGESATYEANENTGQTAVYTWTNIQDGTSYSGPSINPTFIYPGNQILELKVASNGKEFIVRKNVYVKSTRSDISIEGNAVIDPAGLQTFVYTIKKPANASYDVKITGGVKQSQTGDQITVKWGGTAPFSIQVQDIFSSPACNGVPVLLPVKKADQLSNGIIVSGPACLNARVNYGFNGDEYTKDITWSLSGGGTIISTSQSAVSIEWNKTGSYILTLKYERYGLQTVQLPIVVNALPAPEINSGTICGTSTFNLSTTQNYAQYSWYLKESNTAFSTQATPPIVAEGLYTARVTDNNGCVNAASKYIKQLPLPKATVSTEDKTVFCTDPTIGKKSETNLFTYEGQDYKYQWYENNSEIPGATSLKYKVEKPLNLEKYYSYKVRVSLENCVQYSEVESIAVTACNGNNIGSGTIGTNCTDPAVSFSIDPSSSCQTFKFIVDPSITSGTGLGWDFGDGTTVSGLNPTKIYVNADPRVYRIQLTKGCRYDVKPVKILARALFKLDQPTCIGTELIFNELSVNYAGYPITNWTWNFGDGSGDKIFSGTGDRNGKHTYTTAGTYTVRLTVNVMNDQNTECSFTTTNTYEISNLPTADYTVEAPLCTGNTYRFIQKTNFGTNGSGPVKWTFSNGETSVRDTTLQQFAAGNQTVQLKATDRLGCSNTKTSNITVTAFSPVGSIKLPVKDTLLCNGKPVLLTAPLAATGGTYAWRKVGNTAVLGSAQTYSVTSAGEYTVTYSTAASCTGTTAPVKVNGFTVPNLVSGEKLNCVGSVLLIKSNLTQSGYLYTWKHGTDTLASKSTELVINNIKATDAGDYQLTVTQAATGCSVALPVYTVSVNANPDKPNIKAASTAICYNASALLHTETAKAGKTIEWYENSVKLSAADTVLTTALLRNDASYVVSVKDNATGCKTPSESLTIKVAPAINPFITGDTSLCEQVSSELVSALEAKDFTFQWLKNDQPVGGDLSKLTFQTIARADSGIYKLRVTSKGTTNLLGCTAVSNIKTINVKATAVTPVITGVNEFCSGNTITLTSNLLSNFVWNTGAVTPAITVSSGGLYSLTSTNVVSGCKVTVSKTITQNPIPDLNFVPSGEYARCGTNKIVFEGLNPYPVTKWFVNGQLFSTDKIIYPTQSGKYIVQATTAKGCTNVSDTMLINAQECACYVTNTNNTGDGSLREAINCSNEKPGKDAIKFAIVGTGPFVIKPLTALPVISDSVFIDGFSQSGTDVYDIVIEGSGTNVSSAFVLKDKLSNVKVSGLTIRNFNTGVDLNSNTFNNTIEQNRFTNNTTAGVIINIGANKNAIRNNEFTGGGSGVQLASAAQYNTIELNAIANAVSGIEFKGGSNNTVRSNIISGSSKIGILMENASSNILVSNTIGTTLKSGILLGLGANGNTIDANYIGVTAAGVIRANQENGIYIAPNVLNTTISNNTVAGNALNGIYAEGKNTRIVNNYIGTNAAGSALPNGTNGIQATADSIKVAGNSIANQTQYGMLIGNNSSVIGNTVVNNVSGGIYVGGINNTLSKNTITNTNVTVNAIDLHAGVLPAGNLNKQPAAFKSYRRAVSGNIVIRGTSDANDTIEVFYNNDKPQQALLFAGSAKADAAGIWEIEIPEGAAFNPNDKNFYVNTARSTANNTSELSTPFLTGCFTCICYVENTNDAGPGSFREVIDKANAGACLTINFSLTAPDTIRLVSALNPILVPVKIVGPAPGGPDPMIFIKGATAFNGLVVNNEGVTISQLGFTNFNQAVVLNSDYDVVRNVTIVNSKRPLTITGNNAQVFSSAINTTWATDAGTFKADTAVYITGKGNQIGGTDAGNKITNSKTGVLVNGGTSNSILNNAIYANTKAISLVNNGNANYSQPADMLSSITGNTASIQGTAKPFDRIQIFSSTYVAEQATGFVVEAVADAAGNWTAIIPSDKITINQNNYFVATATGTTGNTSPLSTPIRVGNYVQVCYVTNTNDLGEGSLREAVNCANQAGFGTNGVAARIEFLLPSAPNEITLGSKLVVTNNYGVAVNARSIPVTVKTSTPALNCFEWSTNNFQVKNLVFQDFANALYCTGQNAVIDSNSFIGNQNAIYINAVDSIKQQTISNNYFTGGTSSINSVRGSLIVTKNTFGISKAGIAAPINGYGISALRARSVEVTSNTFANISKSTSPTVPAAANGYVLSVENAVSVISANIITGTVSTALPAIRLYANKNASVSTNKITTAYEGVLIDNSNGITVSQNTFAAVSNNGLNINKSINIKLTQNTVVGLGSGKTPINLNLTSATNASNYSKAAPVILTSTYHDGQLFLIGQSEKFDEVEIFYSNQNKRDLVKYIEKSTADSTGTWIVSFPVSAERSDTLFFRAVATKANTLSSEASVAFNPNLKICLVKTKADDGENSLREAIDKANNDECNLIQFAIPGGGVAEIKTDSELPAITAPLLIIDGTSQPGYVKGSPTVDLINDVANGFNGQNGNQLDIYGMKITNFDVAINILNSKIVNTNDNVIENTTDTGIKIKTTGFIYGTVKNNTIKSQHTGISLDGTAKMQIDQNRVSNFSVAGISITGNNQKITKNIIQASNNTTSVGIAVDNASGTFIEADTIIHAGFGFRITNSNANTILSNVVGKTDSISRVRGYIVREQGISLIASNSCLVSQNTINVNKNAIAVTNSKGYLLNFNTSKKAETGILLTNAPNGKVNNNTIDSAMVGLQVDASHGVFVYNNLIMRSLTYGVFLNTGSDTCRLTANIIGARYFGDPTYAEGAGVFIKSSNNYIGPDTALGLGNNIKQNKKGGVIVDGGKKNAIKYNFFYNNDVTKGRPTAFAIELKNSGNNNKQKPTITSHKWVNGLLHIYGTNNGTAGDSIHVYLGTGGYEEVSEILGGVTSKVSGTWEIIVAKSISDRVPARTTWYVVATATDTDRNTSPLSNMYILGDCYITSLKDTTDNDYPLPNTMRMAMKCANGQANPVGIYFNVAQGGVKEVKLQQKMQDLNNGYGVYFSGKNIPDGVIAGMNAQKMPGASWTIASANAASSITNFRIVQASTGLEVLSDSILVQKLRFDEITETGVLVSNKRIVVDSCVFDTLAIGIKPLSNAVGAVFSNNTFNATKQGILDVNTDSVSIRTNTFNNPVGTGVDINGSTHAEISGNRFNSNKALAKSITWNNSKGSIEGNTFTAHFVENPVSISNTTQILVANNTFRDSADVYLALSDASHAVIINNTFTVATRNSIKTTQVEHTTILNNTVYKARNDAFNLESSSTVFVSKNIVNNVRYTSKTDSALCINIHKGEGAIQSNIGKEEPKNLSFEVKAGDDRRIGIIVKGYAQPGDSIELFFSDSISASMNQYVINTFVQPDGRWSVKIPREFYHRDTVTWYHVIAVAIDADSNTSKTSSVLHIPPSNTKIYVLNTYNTGDNSLRYALRDVNNSDLYSKVIFCIDKPKKEGPYNIKIDSLFGPVYSYKGFEMDGITQKQLVNYGPDQRILVNGTQIQNNYGLDITDSSDACLIKNMWITNARNGMRISNDKNIIEKFYIVNTDSSGVAQLDTAFNLRSNKNEIKNMGITGYSVGVLFHNKIGENKFTESSIGSSIVGIALTDSSYLNYVAKNTFTQTTQHAILLDSVAADNKIESNIFGKENKAIIGNAITIRNSSNQTIVTNRISYFDENVTQPGISSAIVIEGKSSNNFVYNNRIGLDSAGINVHTANVRGVTIQRRGTQSPSGNSIIGNEINGTKRASIHISNSSQDQISENLIGGDSAQTIFGIDTTAIFVTNSINEQINDNTILGYKNYGIELLTSSGIQMHRNTIYSKTVANKAINIHADDAALASNGKIVTPVITSGILTDINTIKLTGTALAGAVVEVYQSVKDTLQAIEYVSNAFASAGTNGEWELQVPKAFFSYATQNTFTAQNHSNNNSSELGATFTPAPVLCQLQNTPSINVIEPRYTPCPGPDFYIEPTDLDAELSFAWKAPEWTDSVKTRKLSVTDTTENLVLKVSDKFGCSLVRSTEVIFKGKPVSPNFIISSNVYAGDTIVLVDISMPVPESYTWYSSPGVTVLPSKDSGAVDMVGEDGNIYPKGVRAIRFVLPDSGKYSIRQTSVRNGCFVDQTKELHAIDKDVNVSNPYFVAPVVESMYAYPNPAAINQDVFVHIKVDTKEEITLSLMTVEGVPVGTTKVSGKQMYDLKLLGNGSNQLFTNNLSAGEYILKLVTLKNENITFKIIIGAVK